MASFAIGRYSLSMTALGEDGLGALFTGTDSRTGDPVYVKELRHRSAVDGARSDATQALSGVSHPSVVHPCAEVSAGGTSYAVVKRPEGELLPACLPVIKGQGLRGCFDLLSVIIDICDAVDALHRAGIVCGEVNATSIVVRPGAPARGCLLTFAPFVPSPPRDYLDNNRELAYVAQEQLRGGGTFASDIYSIGMLLYAAFGERAPYGGDTPYEVADSIVWGDLRPFTASLDGLSDWERQALGSAVDAVGAIATRALQRDPAARYPSVSEMRSALQAIAGRLSPIELGLSLLDQGEFQLAAAVLESVPVGPDSARANVYLGRIYGLHLDEYDKGVVAFKRALKDNPALVTAREGLADLYSSHGRHSLAKRELLELLTAQPDDSGLMLRYARILAQSGEREGALNVLHRIHQLNPYFLPAYREAIAIALADSDLARADAEATSAVERVVRVVKLGNLDPEQVASIYFLRGELLQRRGRRDRAIGWLEKALEYMPLHEPSHSLLAQLYSEAGDTDKAVQHMFASMGLKPGQERVIEGIARIFAIQDGSTGGIPQ
jgi:tetratricopeptide (TPR) repeat protein